MGKTLRKSMKRKSVKRKSMKRKSMKRKSMKRKSMKRINNYQGGSDEDIGCTKEFPICDWSHGMHYGKKKYCRNANVKWMSDGPHGCTTKEEIQKSWTRYRNQYKFTQPAEAEQL